MLSWIWAEARVLAAPLCSDVLSMRPFIKQSMVTMRSHAFLACPFCTEHSERHMRCIVEVPALLGHAYKGDILPAVPPTRARGAGTGLLL